MRTYPSMQTCLRAGCHNTFTAHSLREIYCSQSCFTAGHGNDRKQELDTATRVRKGRKAVAVVTCRHGRKDCRECL